MSFWLLNKATGCPAGNSLMPLTRRSSRPSSKMELAVLYWPSTMAASIPRRYHFSLKLSLLSSSSWQASRHSWYSPLSHNLWASSKASLLTSVRAHQKLMERKRTLIKGWARRFGGVFGLIGAPIKSCPTVTSSRPIATRLRVEAGLAGPCFKTGLLLRPDLGIY